MNPDAGQAKSSSCAPEPVTQLLQAATAGDPKAAADLLPLIYAELRQLAARRLSGERKGHTLQPTALVHEAWLKLSSTDSKSWKGRQHFFAAAAEAMRRILVDHARRRRAAKRGERVEGLVVEDLYIPALAPDDQLLAVHEAVAKFETIDPRKAELVKLRYFVGMTFDEAAEALGIAVPTAKQWWSYARAWLRVEVEGSREEEAGSQLPSHTFLD